MEIIKECLQNGVKINYCHRAGEITSFCIGFNAGAFVEEEGMPLGIAHAVEHMIFKGTKTRTEYEINCACDEVFAFHNAMTNFPYVVYYGSTLTEDFGKGFEIYSDILLHPTFPKEGFQEEIHIICEELKEWSDDLEQHCEDELLWNAFEHSRLKNLIIGTESSVREITLEQIIEFYNTYYTADQCSISVVSSLSFEEVASVINRYFAQWNRKCEKKYLAKYEKNKSGVWSKVKEGMNGSKIQYFFPIDFLDEKEIKALKIFNQYFGEGTSSLLFDEIRTKNGFAYEVASRIQNERGMKFFTITVGTSKEHVEKVLHLIDRIIEDSKANQNVFSKEVITVLAKRLRRKQALNLEQSIRLSMNLTIHEIMYGSSLKLFEELEGIEEITGKELQEMVCKVFVNPTIQILQS